MVVEDRRDEMERNGKKRGVVWSSIIHVAVFVCVLSARRGHRIDLLLGCLYNCPPH